MKKATVVLLAMMMLGSCYYSSNETHFVQVEPGPEPQISVSVNLDTLPPITITDSLEVAYEITLDGGDLYQVDFFLDGYYIFKSDSLANSFYINPTYIQQNGEYDLDMKVYYSTNSGTLANKFDAEAFEEVKNWLVTINREEEQ